MVSSESHDLAEQLVQVTRELLGAADVQQTLQRMVDLAVQTIDGCDHAGLSLLVKDQVETPAQSDNIPEIVDEIQNTTGEGPCLDAIREHEVFETGDLAAEDRWPRLSIQVMERTGVRSALAMRLFTEHDTMGALNLYAKATDAVDDDDRSVASIFAAHAAFALCAAQRQEQLIDAIETRDAIGQAQGIIMTRSGVDDDEAFEVLRDASNRMDIKLREVARRIVQHQRER